MIPFPFIHRQPRVGTRAPMKTPKIPVCTSRETRKFDLGMKTVRERSPTIENPQPPASGETNSGRRTAFPALSCTRRSRTGLFSSLCPLFSRSRLSTRPSTERDCLLGGVCCGPPNRAPSSLGFFAVEPGKPCTTDRCSASIYKGNPATPGRSGGLVHPKTIRLPEVCSTLIPVYSTVPPEHPTARSLLKDFACPRALIKFAEFWPHAFLPMPMPCPCHAHDMQS